MSPRVFSSNPTFQAFGEWIISNGGFIQESLKFTSPDSDLGSQILTTAPLQPSSLLLTCPHALAIDWTKVKTYYSTDFIESVAPHAALCMFVCHEWLEGEKSFWWPYLNILPREFDTPLYFDEEDMKWLTGCNLNVDEVNSRRMSWKEEFDTALAALQSEGVDTKDYTWDLFLWACTVFSSRSFPGKLLNWTTQTSMTEISDPDCLPALFPLIDSVNHQPLTKITWAPGDHALNVISGDEIPAGGEVCNNYGPKSNEELLMGYGFTLPSNPFDTVVLRFLPVLSPTQVSVRELQLPSPFPEGIYHLSSRNPDGSLYPRALLDLFHILTATPSEIPLLQENPTAQTVTLRNTLATQHQLLLALRRKLSVFPLESELPQVSNSRRRCAKVYRDTQISILKAAIEESEGVVKSVLDQEEAVTLESALGDEVFNEAVNVCFGSVDPVELQMAGQDDLVFTLYLCWQYLNRDKHKNNWGRWFKNVIDSHQYGSPGESGEEGDGFEDEEAHELYTGLFPAAAEAAPEVFAGEEWTEGLLAWGMRVFGGESMGMRIKGNDGETVVVCVESKGEL